MYETETDERNRREVAQVTAALGVMKAVLETVREFGRAPESAIFLAVKAKGLGLEGYERMKATLVRTQLVKVEHNEFVWVGDQLAPASAN